MTDQEPAPFFIQPLGLKYDFYLTGPIGESSDYVQWFQAIREAKESDQVYLHINSPGGNLYTALQFIRAFGECEAPIIGSLEGEAASAAGVLFLSCDYYQISPFSTFMAHNYSAGTFGKGGEMFDQIVYERKWSTDLIYGIYEGFLTSKEMDALLNNKDIWLDSEQISMRLDKKIHHEQKQLKKMMKEAHNETSGSSKKPVRQTRGKSEGEGAVVEG